MVGLEADHCHRSVPHGPLPPLWVEAQRRLSCSPWTWGRWHCGERWTRGHWISTRCGSCNGNVMDGLLLFWDVGIYLNYVCVCMCVSKKLFVFAQKSFHPWICIIYYILQQIKVYITESSISETDKSPQAISGLKSSVLQCIEVNQLKRYRDSVKRTCFNEHNYHLHVRGQGDTSLHLPVRGMPFLPKSENQPLCEGMVSMLTIYS